MKTYVPGGGENITETAQEMVKLANFSGQVVTAEFNEIPLDTAPGGDADAIVRGYNEACEARHAAYVASPEYAQHQREYKEREEAKAAATKEALSKAPTKLTLLDAAGWQKSVDANNDDGYGAAVMRYADKWARIMESRISAGESVEACADAASHVADDEGITGFQYGCAVGILSQCWIHGEALRRWHNRQYMTEEKAQAADLSGGVVNPAILTIG